MDQELEKRFATQGQKLDAIYRSVEQMRSYFLWTLIITVAVIALPLIGLVFVLPQFLDQYSGLL
ncbi:MAG: hypothetical protein A3J10_01680 [Candidatus Sungbacteria bacterium RIFCSPLOWO2_02_FULL_54_10]|uniref:Uncharacterized protein n=2 Tax=Candidatus Sungiibacteriota TaxID=1817917 RepID=A0A1G2L5X0_9BACT|nr:MAG: hypothetical protein A2679_00460 [Candidatus Sungbacteria bacterium RIFCSPHIGHO2_01_FULL_54_26]OHA04055.1 MAG: hypothetical protein A3C92_03750 [Candidatus Sungbacteria bacterium RIFCSPHIGHO2_02_FULL_53_17]OHA06960.1 MAG: hypothetical protein A3B34_03875 [Candidatus Sungbacteria bacterium RIFCSPLOWO2_01_FULL_54_21]OHA12495.1 MAG: hypothetical protein A3J10_01680 [Candidatus Sungbacteria bacterium RIFCSPLOWO2_02_FULL_54_10]